MPFVRRYVSQEVDTTKGVVHDEHITYVRPAEVRADDEVLSPADVTPKQRAWLLAAHPEEVEGGVAAAFPELEPSAAEAMRAFYAPLAQKEALAAVQGEADAAKLLVWLEVELERKQPRKALLDAFSAKGIAA